MKSQSLNVRDIADYLYCRRKSFLKRTRDFKEQINVNMVRGRMKHEVFDKFNNLEKEIACKIPKDSSKQDIAEIYKRVFFEIATRVVSHGDMALRFRITLQSFWEDCWPSFNREISPRVEAVYSLLSKGMLGEELWLNLEPKYITEMKIKSEKMDLSGRIDRVSLIKEDGKEIYIPFELKTGKASEPYESDRIQLASYAVLLEENFNTTVNYGYMEYSDNQIKIEISKDMKRNVAEIIEGIRKISSEKIPPINSNFNKCRNCSLKDDCFLIKE